MDMPRHDGDRVDVDALLLSDEELQLLCDIELVDEPLDEYELLLVDELPPLPEAPPMPPG